MNIYPFPEASSITCSSSTGKIWPCQCSLEKKKISRDLPGVLLQPSHLSTRYPLLPLSLLFKGWNDLPVFITHPSSFSDNFMPSELLQNLYLFSFSFLIPLTLNMLKHCILPTNEHSPLTLIFISFFFFCCYSFILYHFFFHGQTSPRGNLHKVS